MANTTIKSVSRAITLLDILADAGEQGLTLGDISKTTGINASTIHHLLATMKEHYIVEQDPVSKNYRLGIHLIELGRAATLSTSFAQIGADAANELSDVTNQTIHVLVYHSFQRIRVIEVQQQHPVRVFGAPYEAKSLHATGSGKLLLAHLSEEELTSHLNQTQLERYTDKTITDSDVLMQELTRIRELGYAEDREEFVTGIRAITAPIRDATGQVKGAFDLIFPNLGLTEDAVQQWIIDTVRVADALSTKLRSIGLVIE